MELPQQLNKILKIRTNDNAPFTKEELKTMFAAIPQNKWGLKTILLLELNSGISLGEAVGIKMEDIKWSAGVVMIYDFETNAYRKLILPVSVMSALKEYTDIHRKPDNAKVFDVSSDGIIKGLSSLTKEVILKPKTWKALRRTWAKLSFEKNIPIKDMAQSSGISEASLLKWNMHKDVNTNNEVNNNAVDVLQGIL